MVNAGLGTKMLSDIRDLCGRRVPAWEDHAIRKHDRGIELSSTRQSIAVSVLALANQALASVLQLLR